MSRKSRRANLQSGYVGAKESERPKFAAGAAVREPSRVYPDEEVLPDDYPVHPAYCYVADGRVIRSMIKGTVRDLKADIPASEIRRCDMDARDLF